MAVLQDSKFQYCKLAIGKLPQITVLQVAALLDSELQCHKMAVGKLPCFQTVSCSTER